MQMFHDGSRVRNYSNQHPREEEMEIKKRKGEKRDGAMLEPSIGSAGN